MYPFKPEIKPGEPSLRIGNRLPVNGVTLAFVDGPVLESRYTVEFFNILLLKTVCCKLISILIFMLIKIGFLAMKKMQL